MRKRTFVWTGIALLFFGMVVLVLEIVRALKTFKFANFASVAHTMVIGAGFVVLLCLTGVVLYVPAKRLLRFLAGSIASLCVAAESFYLYFSCLVPDFHAEGNKLVQGHVVLVPVQSNSVMVPSFLPFWTRIGYVDGGHSLYRFTYQGREYVLYGDGAKMLPSFIYEYAPTNGS